jgi:cytochrome bd ubiquinol oxidase subunit I
VLLALYAVLMAYNKKPFGEKKMLSFFPFFIALPYFANTTGWLLTETGRQPWAVFGVLKTADAISPTITVGMVLTSLIVFTLLYGALMVADVYLLVKFAKAGPLNPGEEPVIEKESEATFWG